MSEIAKRMVVRLVSGGPKMSVVSVSDFSDSGGPEQGAVCSWFDDKKNHQEKVFDVAILEPCPAEPTSLTMKPG